jgi:membrane protease YdiL (CAAX protease family)
VNPSSIRRNLVIFSALILLSGWIYQVVNIFFPGPTPEQNLGILLWILTPLAAVLILRGFGGDGWKDFGLGLKGPWGWYALSILAYPLAMAVAIGLGALFGVVSLNGFAEKGFGALAAVAAAALIPSAIKNIFEEFAWRGYLTPRFEALGIAALHNHLLTGLVWGFWHVPYWLFFIGTKAINEVTSLGMFWFIVTAILGIFPTALVYGELRRKTHSVWPAWLAHNVTNILSAQLITTGLVKLENPAAELLFSPTPGGLVMMALFAGLGWWMLKQPQPAK